MINSVLVVCIGNVCRSPIGERLLRKMCPEIRVDSAGLGALVGHEIDKDARIAALQNSVDVEGHIARQFDTKIADDYDLILVMEKGHLGLIRSQAPQASGKSMLFGQWVNQADIPDPYRKSLEFHAAVFQQIQDASLGWAKKLTGNKNG